MVSIVEGGVEDAMKLCTLEDEFGNYDVFISHRGPDIKTGFVGYLYEALKRVGLYPFLDCTSIDKGQDSWKCIDHAIRTTPLALVIFSETFAQSKWCLKELHAMLDSPSMKVLPIFYKVQPWEVSFPEKGQLACGFMKLVERHDMTVIEEWRADLKRASKLSGWEHKEGDKRLEKDLVLEVVGKIFELSNKLLPLDVGDHIVGVKQVAKNLIQALDEKKMLLLGLWGRGGIGKTTLAKELYNQLGQRFDIRCYIEDVSEKVNQDGVMSVQNHILKALCENESMQNIANKSRGKVILEERLSKKSFLLILDDVRDDDEMYHLMPRKMLKEGSICIVTSQDCRVFERSTLFYVKHEILIHDVQILNKEDSRSVFAFHTFGGDLKVPPRFEGLVGDVSMACGGVPLVLKVFGSCLKDEEDVKIWKEVLKKLKGSTIMDDTKIFEYLINYDSLQYEHQDMFWYFAHGLLGASAQMAKLVRRCQGRFVAKFSVLPYSFGGLQKMENLNLGGSEIRSLPASFGRLSNLKVLNLHFCWKLKKLPDSFGGLQNLKNLDLHGSGIQSLPESLGKLSNLEVLDLRDCVELVKLPDSFGSLQNLKNLDLHGSGIQSLPMSIGKLSNLEVLNQLFCSELKKLPNSFGGLLNLK